MEAKNFSQQDNLIFNLGYESGKLKCIYIFLSIVTLGIFNILTYWKNDLKKHFYKKTNHISQANFVFIQKNNIFKIIKLTRTFSSIFKHLFNKEIIYFSFNHHIYVFDKDIKKFILYPSLLKMMKQDPNNLQYYQNGLDKNEIQTLKNFFGKNIIEVKIPKFTRLFVDEILSPFFIYQFSCVILWILDEYEYYAFILLFLTLFSILAFIRERINAAKNIQKLAFQDDEVMVFRKGKHVAKDMNISSLDLVPGDIIYITPESVIPCDVVLIEGICIVNEGMLTGESTPIKKTSYENTSQIKSSNVLLSGTKCLMSKGTSLNSFAFGIVGNTGYYTFKGELVRGIIMQETEEFRFHRDSYHYLKITFLIATLGVLWYFYFQVYYAVVKFTWFKRFVKGFEFFTCAVPPTLPLCLTLGLEYSVQNLKKKNIQTLLMGKINLAGRVKIMCFDKTGTLTENNLIFHGYIFKKNSDNMQQLTDMTQNVDLIEQQHLIESTNLMDIYEIFSCCHNLSYYENHIVGDPLELKMFNQSYCDLLEMVTEFPQKLVKYITPADKDQNSLKKFYKNQNFTENLQYQILRVFEFSSERKQSSVIFYNPITNKYKMAIKGVPEQIVKICKEESIPFDFYECLDTYSKEGLRTIGLASKDLKESEITLSEQDLEKNFNFDGFMFFQNPLKPETCPTIQLLKNAGIKTTMITGDLIYTALNVAVNADIISRNKNIWIGELNEEDNIKWVYIESQAIRDNRKIKKRSSSFESALIFKEQNKERGYSIFEQLEDFKIDPFTKQQTLHVLKRVQEKDCDLALTGDCFELLFKDYLKKDIEILDIFLNHTKIYGRTNPEQKAFIVKCIQKLMSKKNDDYFVGYCGDGANDCTALQCANIGLSLSELEASIASPFVSTVDNISSIVDLLLEGKACLYSGLQGFQYMSCSSLIQFLGVLHIYQMNIDFSNGNYYIMDIFTNFPLSILMIIPIANNVLNKKYPHSNIFNLEMMASSFGHLIIIFISFQFMVYYYQASPIYIPLQKNHKREYEVLTEDLFYTWTYGISGLCCFVYLIIGLLFSKGYPFKLQWYKNKLFLFFVIGNLLFQMIFLFGHGKFNSHINYMINSFSQVLTVDPRDIRMLVCFSFLVVFIMYIHEFYIVRLIVYLKGKAVEKKELQSMSINDFKDIDIQLVKSN